MHKITKSKQKKIKTMPSKLIRVIIATLPTLFVRAAADLNTVRIMIAYSDAAKKWIENTTAFTCASLLDNYPTDIKSKSSIQHPCELNEFLGCRDDNVLNLMEVLIEESNQILQNSGVLDVEFELASSYHVQGYVEGYMPSKPPKHAEPMIENLAKGLHIPHELMSLRNKDDKNDSNNKILNQVHQHRLEVGADIVVFLVAPELYKDDDALGIKELTIKGLASEIGVLNENNAFAVLTVDIAAGPAFSFAQEVFLLMGGNHVTFTQFPILGATDVIAAVPYTLQDGSIDNWAYNNPGESYSTLLGGCEDCTILPILSSTKPTISGTFGTRLNNNAKSVSLHASHVSRFSDNLLQDLTYLSTQWSDRVFDNYDGNKTYGIDFGFDFALGWNIGPGVFLHEAYDFRTYDDDCDLTNGFGCIKYWNNVISTSETTTSMPLRNQKGQLDYPLPIEISIKKGFYSKVKASNMMAMMMSYGLDEMPTMAMTDGMTAIKSKSYLSKGANPAIELINLDTCRTYTFQFFCSYGPVYDFFGRPDLTQRRALFKTIGKNVQEAELDCQGNYMRFATVNGVAPNGVGSLVISLMAIDPTPNGELVSLNAIKFQAEPGSRC